jgi:type IV pilus assembly protein PilB
LVRVLCTSCRKPVTFEKDVLLEAGLDPKVYKDTTFYESQGCPECGFTGYRGRTAIAELLQLSDEIREMILDRKPLSEVRRRAKLEGMIFLREIGMAKVLKGVTSLRELNKVTFVE